MVPLLFFMTLVISGSSIVGGPTEDVRKTTDKLIKIVSDPALKEPDKARREPPGSAKPWMRGLTGKRCLRGPLQGIGRKGLSLEKEEFNRSLWKAVRTYLSG